MIDAILRALIVGGSAYAGARMGEKYLTGATETPVWTGHVGGDVGKPAVSITQVRYRGRVYYRVYVATEGQWALVAACWLWPEVLGVLQTWERYLSEGGTVAAWFAHNAQRAEEIRNMEEAWRSRFVCHPDGTVDEEAYCSE
ncbi:MAG: hypothetical protein ACLQLO_22065 [Mycobacterium sp.]